MLRTLSIGVLSTLAASSVVQAQPEPPAANLPVREVTVFKDGFAFIARSGSVKVDERGDVRLDDLPSPVLGTFWPFSSQPAAKLVGVTAGARRTTISRTALSIPELLKANLGAEVTITEIPASDQAPPAVYPATILSIPTRSAEEIEATQPPGEGQALPVQGEVVLLRTVQGTKALPINRILDITFKNDPQARADTEEFRNQLLLDLDWGDAAPQVEAEVGFAYLQRGLRWIPQYKVTLDGDGTAVVKLQATLVNDLADLSDVTANLVVGVPSFAFKDQLDPISVQQAMVQVAQQLGQRSRDAYLSNAIQSQVAAAPLARPSEPSIRIEPGEISPQVGGTDQAEDLFVYTVRHITLKKGDRMVVPISEATMPYRDVYTLDIPFTPPPEVWASIGQRPEMMKSLATPTVLHAIRLTNETAAPLTTAPAIVFLGDRPLSQGMMTYTAAGGQGDLPLTAAVNVKVAKTDVETRRIPNALQWNGDSYSRVDLSGEITLANYGTKPVTVEVKRHVLGEATSAGADGKVVKVNVFEDAGYRSRPGDPNPWPYLHGWPGWWSHVNGIGRIEWMVTVPTRDRGDPVKLGYTWQYFWR